MIIESGRVVAIEAQGLWVETIQQSVCGSCRAQKGCGHSMVAKFGASASRLWVLLEGRDPGQYKVDDQIKIGVPEGTITRGALFIYMVPLMTMLAAIVLAHQQALSDAVSVFWAAAGLLLGAVIVRLRAHQTRFDSRLQPVLIDDQQLVRVQATTAF